MGVNWPLKMKEHNIYIKKKKKTKQVARYIYSGPDQVTRAEAKAEAKAEAGAEAEQIINLSSVYLYIYIYISRVIDICNSRLSIENRCWQESFKSCLLVTPMQWHAELIFFG